MDTSLSTYSWVGIDVVEEGVPQEGQTEWIPACTISCFPPADIQT